MYIYISVPLMCSVFVSAGLSDVRHAKLVVLRPATHAQAGGGADPEACLPRSGGMQVP